MPNSGKLSKIDDWNKLHLFNLFENLHKAEQLLYDVLAKQDIKELAEFKQDYTEHLNQIKFDNVADFSTIWKWFSPADKWQTLLSDKGKELGDKIFCIADNWKRNQDFLIGTKVSLNNEFGVVIDKTEDWNEYGLIRWDTDIENDVEDWRGLFGSFLDAGGQIISQDHKFLFINDNGSWKKASR